MKFALASGLAIAAGLAAACPAFGDEIGRDLRDSMVWVDSSPDVTGWLHAGFRRDIVLDEMPSDVSIHLFAYTRYKLFVNGEYVGRGPNRFENRRPEYDTWQIAPYLRAGQNCIAVGAHRDWPGVEKTTAVAFSRLQLHAHGFAARIDLKRDGERVETIRSDERWVGFSDRTFGDPNGRHYASIAVAIFNRSDEEATIEEKLADIGIDGSRSVRDLWRQREVGMLNQCSVRVGAHGAELFRIRRANSDVQSTK